MRERLASADVSSSRWVRTLPHPRTVDQSLVALSRATDHSDAWLAVSLAGAAIDRRRRNGWIDAGARIALVELSSRAIKRALPRERPRLERLPPLASTPSPMSFSEFSHRGLSRRAALIRRLASPRAAPVSRSSDGVFAPVPRSALPLRRSSWSVPWSTSRWQRVWSLTATDLSHHPQAYQGIAPNSRDTARAASRTYPKRSARSLRAVNSRSRVPKMAIAPTTTLRRSLIGAAIDTWL
jgi:hypothetical protein